MYQRFMCRYGVMRMYGGKGYRKGGYGGHQWSSWMMGDRCSAVSYPIHPMVSMKKSCLGRCGDDDTSGQFWTYATSASGEFSPGQDSRSTTSSSARPGAFRNLERLISDSLGSGGPGGNWEEMEGCWVLRPPEEFGPPKCSVHFVGGAFVGAAPQLGYSLFLESLAKRGALIIATPYPTSFEHTNTADNIYFMLSRCLKALGPTAQAIPSYGLGHSLGALMHLLICSRYVVPRAGNIFMSFNNRPATDAIPFLSPFIAPSARALGPLLSQLATSPLRSGVEQWIDILKGLSPGVVRQIIPVLEQLTPIFLDVAQGSSEFSPNPEEIRNMIKSGYAVNKNYLIKFVDDTIDETPSLASVLQSSAISASLDLTLKSFPGDHVRPLQQDLSRISPDLARFTSDRLSDSDRFWSSVTSLAEQASIPEDAKQQLTGLAKAGGMLSGMLGEAVGSVDASKNIESLANEIADWIGLPKTSASSEIKSLPAPPTPSSNATPAEE